MTFLTKAQALARVRPTQPLQLPEFSAPLLVAEMSGRAALRIQKVGNDLEARLTFMVADQVVNEDGSHMFTAEEVPNFLDRLSIESSTALLRACTSLAFGGGDLGNSKPSTSAA
jgi:hypothetical protein